MVVRAKVNASTDFTSLTASLISQRDAKQKPIHQLEMKVLQELRPQLDEVVRQKAKEAAAAAKAAAQSDDVEAAEHVMLSYNWGHQDVIKRINTALKARGYSVWIDIEKMQGSTVEAMADAVEDAAVVCYGISQAYKESTNCRMEAQYAFQQQTDMVRQSSPV